MSDFDREKYGDYEEALKRLRSDPIFSEETDPVPEQEAAPEIPSAPVEAPAPVFAAPAEEPAQPLPEPEPEPEPAADEEESRDFGEPPAETPPAEYVAAAGFTTASDGDSGAKKRRDPVTGVFEWVESAIFAVVVVILLFTFVFRIVGIDGRSMVPTLQDDDRVVISNLFYTPKTGDIVVLDTSEDTIFFNGRQYSKPLIKRVIATGGQTVEVTSSENGVQEVYVDGVKLQEDYINYQTLMRSSGQEKITVPNGYVFVMGDNRGESLDSRSFGCIKVEAIVGRALFRIFPLSEMGLLTNG